MTNRWNVIVPEKIKMDQETQISYNDLTAAIKNMNNNKTPGEDGIPIDFFLQSLLDKASKTL